MDQTFVEKVGQDAAPILAPAQSPARPSRTITRLAELPGKTLLDEQALAEMLGITKRTVRRMVIRYELPPPIPLAGRSTWLADRVLAHIEERAEKAARKAERDAVRLGHPA